MANYVYATDPRKPIPIGVQGENDARTVVFDIHKWIEDYGNGTALLVHQRPGDAEPYPVTTAQKAGQVEWTVQQADIIAGAPGRAQLSYQVGDNIVARSPIYMTVAADEITNTPLADYDPAKSWIDDLLDAVNKAGDITSDVQAAQTAATQAGQSATAAAGSASDAAESAAAAANSAAQAAQHAGEVTSGVQAAAQSATQAAGSATAASGSASAAAGSATEAAGSAADAAESAGNAAESASQAASSASAAQEAAENAQEYSGKPPIIQNDTWWTWDAETDKYEDTGHPATGEAAGFGSITATVDNAVGVPVVTVTESGGDTAKNIAFTFKNLKGEPGTAAGFGSATASVDGSTGTPDVTVSVSGPDTAKVFNFQFSGLKGETGAAAGFGQITATVGAEVGTPSVSVETSGPDTAKNLAFTFANLKGEPGQSVGSIQRTAGTGAPGTTDTYTMYDSDGGTIGTFTVYNGTDGTGSGDFKADGSVPMTGELNAGEHKIINVAAPTADGDAANKAYVDSAVDNVEIVKTASGNVISVSDSADYRLLGLKLYGKSVQDGVPTPEAPVEIESVMDPTVVVAPKNLIDYAEWSKVGIQNGTGIWQDFGIVITSGEGGDAYTRYYQTTGQGYKINVIPGITYKLSWEHTGSNGSVYIFPNGSLTGLVQILTNVGSSLSYTAKEGDSFITFRVGVRDANATATYKNVMLSIDSDTTFVPYGGDAQTLTYLTPNGLPGIPVESGGNYTDEDGQQWICDEVDFGRGKYVQRVEKITLTGDMSWHDNTPWDEASPDVFHYFVKLTNKKVDTQDGANNLLCTTFECKTDRGNSLIDTECIYSNYASLSTYAFLNKSRASTPDLEGFKGWINQNQPVIYYILQNPIETDLTPDQITAYAALTTYKPHTTITTDSDPAAGIEAKYLTDSGVAEVLDYYASKDDLDGKQDKLTGQMGQFVGFGADGEAEAQEITAADVGAMAAVDGGTTGQYLRKTADGEAWQDGPDLSGYATEDWVTGRGYITDAALTGYATQAWVEGKGYLTAVPDGYATESWVQSQGYLTAIPQEYVTSTELTQTLSGYAPKGFTWTGTLTASGWSGSAAPYTQTLTISGMQATDNPFLGPNYTSSDVDTVKAQEEAFSLIGRIDSGAGTATVYIYEDSKPEVDIPILVKVVR